MDDQQHRLTDAERADYERRIAEYEAQRASRCAAPDLTTLEPVDDIVARSMTMAAKAQERERQRLADAEAAKAEHQRRLRDEPEYRAWHEEQELRRVAEQLARAGVPPRLRKVARWARVDTEQRAQLQGILRGDLPNGIVLQGPVGVGKSCAAVLVAAEFASHSRPFRWIKAGRILSQAHQGELPPEWLECPALFVDELSADNAVQPWARERLLLLLDERREYERFTLWTTNSEMEMLAQTFGERFVSRLFDLSEVQLVVWATGIDRRTSLADLRPV